MLFIDANALDVVLIIVTSLIGIIAISAGLERFFLRKLEIYEVIPLLVGGLLMIYPGTVTDIIGVALVAVVAVLQIVIKKKPGENG